MSAHTPGPWTLNMPSELQRYRTISAPSEPSLMGDAAFYPWCPYSDEDWRLIAAAPDLLEALQSCLPFIDDAGDIAQFYPDSAATDKCRAAVAAAREAIAKATGTR